MRIIYDFGANNGDDIPYYLKKSELVVAVEAIPALVDRIRERFPAEIGSGRLVILNCVLADVRIDVPVPFYVHKLEHYRSQYLRPPAAELAHFETITLPSRRASDIIRHFGDPYYVKIDIEGYDDTVLKEVFSAGIRPDFISGESHHIDVFASMVSIGGYNAFKLVDGPGVSVRYQNSVINAVHGQERYSFPTHSAGPFGDDIAGPWMTADNFFKLLAFAGLGWKDVHAARDIAADPAYVPTVRIQLMPEF